MSKKAAGERKYHHGNLREALLETSAAVIEESGVGALTLREIGSRLGVSRMAAYRHFSDKAALLGALRKIGFERFANALREARDSKRGQFARLEEMAVAYVRFAEMNKAHFQVMFGAGAEELGAEQEADRTGEPAFQVLLDAVAEAQRAGKVTGSDPLPVAHLLWATVHGISSLGLEPDWRGEARMTREMTRMLRRGVGER